MAARVRGPMPSGFSLDASLTMVSGLSPSSRASSETGLPGWYGAMERTYEGDCSQRSISMSVGYTLSGHRHRIGAQDLEKRRLGAQRLQRRRHVRVLLVTLEVDEEEVFPQGGAGARRARLDAAHGDAVGGERREQRVHRAGLVLGRHHERSAVAPARRRVDLAEREEARGVARVVLDRARQRGEAVALAGGEAGKRCAARLLRGA